MADLTETQRSALAGLLARCPTPMLAHVDAMAAAIPGAKAEALRQLAAVERQNRDRRDLMMSPLDPLFRPRADGLSGLSFPPHLRALLWSLAITHEPQMLKGLDRGDQVSRTVADRLCLMAAMELRDRPALVWPEASEAQIEDLAGCLDLVSILRRHLGHMDEWLRGGTAEATADLKFVLTQASTMSEQAPARLLEILFAHTVEARYFLRLLGQILPLVGREVGMEEAVIHRFTHRLIEAVAERCHQVASFDIQSADRDLASLRAALLWASDVMAEFDAQTLIRPDAEGGRLLRHARQEVSKTLGDYFLKAEQVVLSLLPVQQTVMAGKMKRPMPRLDQALDEATVAEAKALLQLVAISRGPALVFGREADRRQTAESLTWRLASWADEALERVNDADAEVEDTALALRRISMTADLLAQIEAREAARSIRRRLMALTNRREHFQAATLEASPQEA